MPAQRQAGFIDDQLDLLRDSHSDEVMGVSSGRSRGRCLLDIEVLLDRPLGAGGEGPRSPPDVSRSETNKGWACYGLFPSRPRNPLPT